jgi:hypothetical protein
LSRDDRFQRFFADLPAPHRKDLQKWFARWMLENYKYRIKQMVARQRFPETYQPLSPAWEAYKKKHYLKPGFWRATGTLMRHITIWHTPFTETYHIGWPWWAKTKKLPGKRRRVKLAMVAQVLEMGSERARIPSRPLLVPVAQAMARRGPELFLEFLGKHYPMYYPAAAGITRLDRKKIPLIPPRPAGLGNLTTS